MPRQFHRERIFSTNGAGTVGQPYVKNTNLNSYLTPGITDRNISPNTRKLLKENIGENLSVLRLWGCKELDTTEQLSLSLS